MPLIILTVSFVVPTFADVELVDAFAALSFLKSNGFLNEGKDPRATNPCITRRRRGEEEEEEDDDEEEDVWCSAEKSREADKLNIFFFLCCDDFARARKNEESFSLLFLRHCGIALLRLTCSFYTLLLFASLIIIIIAIVISFLRGFRDSTNLCGRSSLPRGDDGFTFSLARFRRLGIFGRRGGAHFDDGFFL